MGKFYLENELPSHISELAGYLVKIYQQDEIMTFNFHLQANMKICITHNPGSKNINYVGNPVISMVSLGFGTITYTDLDTRKNLKNMGVFTINNELLKWHDYKIASPIKKKWIRLQENILENKVYISIIISIIALMISIFRY